MAFVKAQRSTKKARVALLGPSGAGKTYTALQLAKGIAGEDGRIALIDTENHSAELYADVVDFDVLCLERFSPRDYIAAIAEAAAAGYSVLIIDSLSHAWVGKGGVLEQVDNASARSASKNSFGAWRDVTPEHNRLVDALVRAPLHLVVTMRTKVEWVLEQDAKGRTVPRKVGMAPVQREGLDYEFDIVADMDDMHRAIVTKTRCSALADQVIAKPGPELGKQIRDWLSSAPASSPAAPVPAVSAPEEDVKKVGTAAVEEIMRIEKLDRRAANAFLADRVKIAGAKLDADGIGSAMSELRAEWARVTGPEVVEAQPPAE
ncbi:MAG: ATP-binding protein [Patescibacteria group bacterium]|jgi:hypothetical protein